MHKAAASECISQENRFFFDLARSRVTSEEGTEKKCVGRKDMKCVMSCYTQDAHSDVSHRCFSLTELMTISVKV